MRIAITGINGFIGKALAKSLANAHTITGLSRSDVSMPGIKIIQGDVRDSNAVRQLCKAQDIIIHLACISNDPSFELDSELGKSINYKM